MPRNSTSIAAPRPPADATILIQDEMNGGRFQRALDLAKEHRLRSPSPESDEQLRQVLLVSTRCLIKRKLVADARRWLADAEKFDGPPAWWESLALLRAQIGDGAEARTLIEKAAGSTALPRILGFLADQAMLDRQRGRDLLPIEQHAAYDAVRSAFANYDQGKDEEARQALQAIGIQSPFLDWKLMLRGLIAYSTNDDQRAIENWARLDSERLPAQLVLPFRHKLDKAFRSTLKAEQEKTIAKRAVAIAHPLLGQLRELQRLMASPDELPVALRKASMLFGSVKAVFPDQATKLANCFYWLIVGEGEQEDVNTYRRVFGPHPDDKNLYRMQAQMMESRRRFEEAHKYWKNYHDEIAKSPERWPGEQGRRARAMIWARMADAAMDYQDDVGDEDAFFDEFMEFMGGRHRSKKAKKAVLTPGPEQCLRNAVELAPDWKVPSLNLMHLLRSVEQLSQAEEVGQRFLQAHPDDIDVLLLLVDLQYELGKLDEALNTIQRAVQNNPLDKKLRMRLVMLKLEHARVLIGQGEYEAVREALRHIVEHENGLLPQIARAMSAACSLKNKQADDAARLMAEMDASSLPKVATAYIRLVEFTRLKVAKSILKERQDEFDAAMNGPLNFVELQNLAAAFTFYRQEPVAYRGITKHEKAFAAKLQEVLNSKPGERELVELGLLLLYSRYSKLLLACAKDGHARFKQNPAFLYFLGEQEMMQKPKGYRVRQVAAWFKKVLKQTEGSQDELSRTMREAIEKKRQEHPRLDDHMRSDFDLFRLPFGFGGF